MAKNELKGNIQLRFAEGLLRVWSTLWLITELSNDKEPAIHLNLFFSYHSPGVLVEKRDFGDFYICIMSAPYITVGTKRQNSFSSCSVTLEKMLFCDIYGHWKTYCCYGRTATALNAFILCIG